MAQNYSEMITDVFGAIDKIVEVRLQGLNFDNTILCRVVSLSNEDTGEYEVTDGSTTFKAYSTAEKYEAGDSVYVLVPGNNFENQKTIISKYVVEDNGPINYISPMESFLKCTDDLLKEDGEKGLIANGDILNIRVGGCVNPNVKGYSLMGFSADFKTYLADLETASGDYGINIYVKNKPEGKEEKVYLYTFKCADMFGDPYNFNGYYNQECVFNIADLQDITDIEVYLYQQKDFNKIDSTPISVAGDNNIFVSMPALYFGKDINNLNLGEVYLYTKDNLTYNNSSSDKEKTFHVRWFLDKEHIIDRDEEFKALNSAELHLLKFEKKEKQKIEAWEEINWYTVSINAAEKGKLDFKTTISTSTAENNFMVVIDYPSFSHQEKLAKEDDTYVTIGYIREMCKSLTDFNKIKNDETKKKIVIDYIGDIFKNVTTNIDVLYENLISKLTITIASGSTLKQKYDAIDGKLESKQDTIINNYKMQSKLYKSNILSFKNRLPVADDSTSLFQNGIVLEIDKDGYNGSYFIYNKNNKIMSESESQKQRTITANFKELIEKVGPVKTITWFFPIEETMLYYKVPDNAEKGILTQKKNSNGLYNYTFEKNGTKYCKVEFSGTTLEKGYSQNFKVKKNFVPGFTNNQIVIHVEAGDSITDNTKKYEASVTPIFGPKNEQGTEYVFYLEPDKNAVINLQSSPRDIIKFTPKLLKQNGENIDIINNSEIKVRFYWAQFNASGLDKSESFDLVLLRYCQEKNGNYTLLEDISKKENISETDKNTYTNKQHYCEIRLKDNAVKRIDNCKYAMLKCEITIPTTFEGANNINEIKLSAYYPIMTINISGVAAEDVLFVGDNEICYDGDGGNPSYHKAAFELQWKNGNANNYNWNIETEDDGKNYYPKFDNKHKLRPINMFINGLKMSTIVVSNGNTKIFSCPLRIYKDLYSISLLNSWNGSLAIDENNGTILATTIGAGKKDNENKFSGVLMGTYPREEIVGYGLYGYNAGSKNFELNVNGELYLGNENGKGSITMKGGESKIELKDGSENMITLHATRNDITSLFNIQHKGQNLINVSASNFYLKSYNYNIIDSNGLKLLSSKDKIIGFSDNVKITGFYLDLRNSLIKAYDLLLDLPRNDNVKNYGNTKLRINNTSGYPLSIGRPGMFKVSWNHGLFIGGAVFSKYGIFSNFNSKRYHGEYKTLENKLYDYNSAPSHPRMFLNIRNQFLDTFVLYSSKDCYNLRSNHFYTSKTESDVGNAFKDETRIKFSILGKSIPVNLARTKALIESSPTLSSLVRVDETTENKGLYLYNGQYKNTDPLVLRPDATGLVIGKGRLYWNIIERTSLALAFNSSKVIKVPQRDVTDAIAYSSQNLKALNFTEILFKEDYIHQKQKSDKYDLTENNSVSYQYTINPLTDLEENQWNLSEDSPFETLNDLKTEIKNNNSEEYFIMRKIVERIVIPRLYPEEDYDNITAEKASNRDVFAVTTSGVCYAKKMYVNELYTEVINCGNLRFFNSSKGEVYKAFLFSNLYDLGVRTTIEGSKTDEFKALYDGKILEKEPHIIKYDKFNYLIGLKESK